MGAGELIERLALAGVHLSLLGYDKLAADPRSALNDELRYLIRTHKPELVEALRPISRGMELRRERAIAELERQSEAQRWAIFDTDAEPGWVVCTVAVRGVGTCELRIPRERYDPWLVLEALAKPQQ